jgi:hypothetical protein
MIFFEGKSSLLQLKGRSALHRDELVPEAAHCDQALGPTRRDRFGGEDLLDERRAPPTFAQA